MSSLTNLAGSGGEELSEEEASSLLLVQLLLELVGVMSWLGVDGTLARLGGVAWWPLRRAAESRLSSGAMIAFNETTFT